MVNSVANQPDPSEAYSAIKDSSFKVADPQYSIGIDPVATVEEMQNAIWQNIGGHEIISLARRDLVDGKNINYNLISDLAKLFAEFNPKTIIQIQNSSNLYFDAFGIKFESYLPSESDLQRAGVDSINPVVVDSNNNIFIYVSNIKDSYDIEIQSLSAEQVLRDTIYGEDL